MEKQTAKEIYEVQKAVFSGTLDQTLTVGNPFLFGNLLDNQVPLTFSSVGKRIGNKVMVAVIHQYQWYIEPTDWQGNSFLANSGASIFPYTYIKLLGWITYVPQISNFTSTAFSIEYSKGNQIVPRLCEHWWSSADTMGVQGDSGGTILVNSLRWQTLSKLEHTREIVCKPVVYVRSGMLIAKEKSVADVSIDIGVSGWIKVWYTYELVDDLTYKDMVRNTQLKTPAEQVYITNTTNEAISYALNYM